jgi:hypothetical protein
MITVYWVNPDILRRSDGRFQESEGLVVVGGEVNVEIYGDNIPNTIEQYIQRAVQLLNSVTVTPNVFEPEPEPSLILDLFEPEPEYGIWPVFLPIEYSEFQ